MKRILLVLFLFVAVSAYSQNYYLGKDTLRGADTSSITLGGKYTYVMITVKDTGSTITDSIYCQSVVSGYYSTVAVRDLSTFTDVSYAIPGAGVTKKYMILDPYIQLLKIIRKNATAATVIIIEGVKY